MEKFFSVGNSIDAGDRDISTGGCKIQGQGYPPPREGNFIKDYLYTVLSWFGSMITFHFVPS